MNYSIDNLPPVLMLGNEGENNVTAITIDCSAWLEDYPQASMSASIILPGGTDAVPFPSTFDGTELVLHVTRAITARPGTSTVVIRLNDPDGAERRSRLIAGYVREGHGAITGETPEDVPDLFPFIVKPELSFDKSTCVLSITGGNQVELNRGLSTAQYETLTELMSRPDGQWTLTAGAVYSQTSPSRDIPSRRFCRSLWGIGIIHLDFVAKATQGDIAYIPAAGPKAEVLAEYQVFDGGSVWIDGGTRTIKGQGLTVNRRYIFNIITYFTN